MIGTNQEARGQGGNKKQKCEHHPEIGHVPKIPHQVSDKPGIDQESEYTEEEKDVEQFHFRAIVVKIGTTNEIIVPFPFSNDYIFIGGLKLGIPGTGKHRQPPLLFLQNDQGVEIRFQKGKDLISQEDEQSDQ